VGCSAPPVLRNDRERESRTRNCGSSTGASTGEVGGEPGSRPSCVRPTPRGRLLVLPPEQPGDDGPRELIRVDLTQMSPSASVLRVRRRPCIAALLTVVGAAYFGPTADAFTPEPVVNSARVEFEPAVAPGYLAYSRDVAGHPNRVNLIVKPDGSSPFRVNPRGTIAFPGSIDGDTLAFSQRSLSGGRGDIKLFDLIARTRSEPAGINTARHESQSSLAGDWLVFARSRRVSFTSPRRLILRNLATSENRQLDFGDDAYVQGGGLAGNFVSWTRCRRLSHCRTWRYDITAATKTRLPNPLAKSQFAASVTADGTVYYAESGTILCSKKKVVRFWRQPLAGTRELLAVLPRGRDTAATSPLTLLDGSVELVFDRFNATCTSSDIYKVPIPAPGP
jgi:hypothetical protein